MKLESSYQRRSLENLTIMYSCHPVSDPCFPKISSFGFPPLVQFFSTCRTISNNGIANIQISRTLCNVVGVYQEFRKVWHNLDQFRGFTITTIVQPITIRLVTFPKEFCPLLRTEHELCSDGSCSSSTIIWHSVLLYRIRGDWI